MEFVKGLELSRAFFAQSVAPILARHYPGLRYSAGLIGSGSEVIGYDDPVSSDHHWGPRVMLFLSFADHCALASPSTRCWRKNCPIASWAIPPISARPKLAMATRAPSSW